MAYSVKRSISMFIVSLLTIVLLLSSVSTVQASTTLSHDDGERDEWYSTTKGNHLIVGFSLPYGEDYRIIMIDFFVNEPGVAFKFHIYENVGSYTSLYDGDYMLQPGLDPGQWIQAYVTKEVIVDGCLEGSAFWVTVEYLMDNKPAIGLDTSTYHLYEKLDLDRWVRLYSHSFEGNPRNYVFNLDRVLGDLMVRVQVEKVEIMRKEVVTTAVTATMTSTSEGPLPTTTQNEGPTTTLMTYQGITFAVIAVIAVVALAAIALKKGRRA